MSFDAGGGGGYVAVPDVIFKASVKMVGAKEYVYAIASGAVGDLAGSAGMAGDDSIAHSFAGKYEPAARTIVQGISRAGEALGLTASKLLTRRRTISRPRTRSPPGSPARSTQARSRR